MLLGRRGSVAGDQALTTLSPLSPVFSTWLLVPMACVLDRWIGDPRAFPHPVQVMGYGIRLLRTTAEGWARNQPCRLRAAGLMIALLLVGGAASGGWVIEQLALRAPTVGIPLLALALASCLAARSLEQAVLDVVRALPDLSLARSRLAWIVGRDVTGMSATDVLRAAAETASENAVDGVFAPLFWMIVGMAIWTLRPDLPGPLALAWGFKAASTMDSMLGYRRGTLRWLGTAAAKLDDGLTWIPCRLTALTLPLVGGEWQAWLALYGAARREGAADPSPNAGLSQAIYAHVVGIRMGGTNRYGAELREKPILAADHPPPCEDSVRMVLRLTRRLECLWLVVACPMLLVLDGLNQ